MKGTSKFDCQDYQTQTSKCRQHIPSRNDESEVHNKANSWTQTDSKVDTCTQLHGMPSTSKSDHRYPPTRVNIHGQYIQHLNSGSALHSTANSMIHFTFRVLAHFALTQVERELCHTADSCNVVLLVLSYILVSLGLGLLCVAGYSFMARLAA
jgi:hypothetical protein